MSGITVPRQWVAVVESVLTMGNMPCSGVLGLGLHSPPSENWLLRTDKHAEDPKNGKGDNRRREKPRQEGRDESYNWADENHREPGGKHHDDGDSKGHPQHGNHQSRHDHYHYHRHSCYDGHKAAAHFHENHDQDTNNHTAENDDSAHSHAGPRNFHSLVDTVVQQKITPPLFSLALSRHSDSVLSSESYLAFGGLTPVAIEPRFAAAPMLEMVRNMSFQALATAS